MFKLFAASILLTALCHAQEPMPTSATPANLDTADTISQPTPAQKQSIKKGKLLPKKVISTSTDENPAIAPAASTTPKAAPETPIEKKNDAPISTTENSTEPHRFGLHADLNIPHILNYGVDYWHSSRWFSASVNFGGYAAKGVYKTTELPNGADVKISNQEIVARVHPFASSFYLAAALGNHTIEGAGTATYSQAPLSQPITTTITNKITANYVKPHIGWLWRAPFGLTWGADFGVLIPNSSKTTLDEGSIKNDSNYPLLASTSEYKANKQKIIDESERIGTSTLPYWTLIRVGWLF